ncbi:MAG: NAD(P)H-dependent oxidoreductase [Actinomycetota bacterium]
MRLLAFAASNSSRSINRRLVDHAVELLEGGLVPDVTVDTIDLNDFEMPIYSIDRQEADGIPQEAHDFRAAIGRSDGLLISFAEHNGSYTTAFKNLFDWTSRIDLRVYQDKPGVFFATSPGSRGGRGVLETAVAVAPFFGCDVRASLSIPSFHQHVDEATGALTDPELAERLRDALLTLAPSDG